MINKEIFYNYIRASILFKGKLTEMQVIGIESLLNEWDKNEYKDLRWLAYILATVYHETDKTMQPIEEYGKGKNKPYGKKIKYNGTHYEKPDKIYYGRGHTQNTWYEIYERLSIIAKIKGYHWDFLNHPELLLQIEPSAWVTIYAMTRGIYTGRRLSDYFNDKKEDSINARRTINLLDKAELISDYYNIFYKALTA